MRYKINNQAGSVNFMLLIQISAAFSILLLGLISQADWAKSIMLGMGMIKPMHTQVDYYTYIKGIEYLLCVYFLFIFPVFFMFINNVKKDKKA
jgi:hypothetical protein